MERFPSVAQSNVLKPQVGVVQMLNFQSIRTNHDGDSLPKKRGGGLASAMAWSDVGREVFWSPTCAKQLLEGNMTRHKHQQ